MNHLLDQLWAPLLWSLSSFHLEVFQSLWGKQITVYSFREQIGLVIWAMDLINPVLNHHYPKEKAYFMVFAWALIWNPIGNWPKAATVMKGRGGREGGHEFDLRGHQDKQIPDDMSHK